MLVHETKVAYLEGPGLQEADLVMLGQVSEAWDLLGKLHHLPDSRGEAVGELLPNLVAGPVEVHMRRRVHGTNLRERRQQVLWLEETETTQKIRLTAEHHADIRTC